MNYRPARVSSLILEELNNLILRELEFEPEILVTITDVEIDKELGRAKVWVSIIPSEKAVPAMKLLGKNAGKLQFLLHRKINIKPMPLLEFEIDRGPENAAEVEKVLIEGGEK